MELNYTHENQTGAAHRSEEAISNQHYAQTTEISRTYKEYMFSLVDVGPNQRILDVGCGTGMNSSRLAKAGFKVAGVDISPVAIEKYKSHGFEGYACDILKGLPFPDGSFDAAYCSEVIEHVTDTETFLSEIHRVLKPKGRLYLSTPNSAFWPYRFLGLFGKTLTEIQHPGHVRFFSKNLLKRHCEKAGFTHFSFNSRKIFFIFTLSQSSKWGPFFKKIGLNFENKFGTNSAFYHVSWLAKGVSAFWSDTIIVRAQRD